MEEAPQIEHVLVARGVVVLCECSLTLADYNAITSPLLEFYVLNPDELQPRVVTYGQHAIAILPQDGYIFLAICRPVSLSPALMQGFLKEAAEKFITTYGPGEDMANICLPYSLNEFGQTLRILMVLSEMPPSLPAPHHPDVEGVDTKGIYDGIDRGSQGPSRADA